MTLTHVTLTGNHAGGSGAFGSGGAVYSQGPSATISGSTISNNSAGGGAGAYGYGGGIDVKLPTVSDSTFRSNTAGGGAAGAYGYGGAIESVGTASLTRTVVAGNKAGGGTGAFGYGGGVDSLSGAATLSDSAVLGNTAGGGSGFGYGGGVNGSVTAERSTISGNTAGGGGGFGYGGGIENALTPASLTNSTVSGNAAGGGSYGYGGGIDAPPAGLTLTSSDVDGNTAATSMANGGGGGVHGPVTSRDSIIANNTSAIGDNCSAATTSLGHNLENGASCGFTAPGDIELEIQPGIGPLKDNGGLTPTQALLPGNPAINGGETSGCPATDQRGVVRPQGTACDIGAYELAPPAAQTGLAKLGTKRHVRLAGTGSSPDVVAGSAFFQWGKTTAYGNHTTAQPFPALASGRSFSASVGKLAPGTLYHYRAVVTNGDSTAYGADRTIKTPAAPALKRLAIKPRNFRASSGGATISYFDTQPGVTTFTVLRRSRGYRVGSRCVAHKPRNPKHPGRCARYSKLGSFHHRDSAGANHLRFSGRVGHRSLSAGSYRLSVQASNGFGAVSRALLRGFRIVH